MKLFAAARRRPSDAAPEAADLPHLDTVPIARYERVRDGQVIAELPQLTQTQLTAVETYERTHAQRAAVLDKLRYLRGTEPLAGYDRLTEDEMPGVLGTADLETIENVRSYERRLRRRDRVLSEVERVRRQLRSDLRRDQGAAARER
jgi:hypothetical protein